MRKYKGAVIGCGRMGAITTEKTRNSVPPIWLPLSHTDAINSIDAIDLVAVCDSSQEQVDRVWDKYPWVKKYTDYAQLLDEIRPDFVGIATRTQGRALIIRDCAVAGVKGIHAEKPLSGSMEDCSIALDALRKYKSGFTFGAVRRYMSPYILAKSIIDSGEIGKLRQIVIEHGSDMLLWGHPHCIDLANFMTSGAEITRVQSRLNIPEGSIKGNVLDCDPLLNMAYLEFETGVSAIITAGHGFNVRLYGETGSVTVVGDGTRVELRKKEVGRPYELECHDLQFDGSISGTKQAFLNLVEYAENGTPTGISCDDIEMIHRALLGLAQSEILNGTGVSPREIPKDFVVTGRFGALYA